MMYLMVAGGLALLLIGGDVLVRGAVTLAQRLEIPSLVIGLTVVAFGTSAPELVVSVGAALKGVPELAIGNVVGSNIANVLLVLGIPALIAPIACDASTIRRETAIMVGVTVAFLVLCLTGELRVWHGALMAAGLGGYLVWSYMATRKAGPEAGQDFIEDLDGIGVQPHGMWLSIGFIVAGIAGLMLGSDLLVNGAVDIARAIGLSEATIGLTLVALGTSLPELATALVAALRRHGDVAIGNVIGSNLFNILGIMGITAMIRPIPVPASFLTFDLWVMLGAAVLLTPFVARGSNIGRVAGTILTLAYAVYIWLLFSNGTVVSGPVNPKIAF
jgi:cation:H+ antiporter